MDSKNVLGLWSLHNQFMNVIITWLAKIMENITCENNGFITRGLPPLMMTNDHNHT